MESVVVDKTLHLLNKTISDISRASTLDGVLISTVSTLRELFRSEIVSIREFDKAGKRWIILKQSGTNPLLLTQFEALQEIQTAVQDKLQQGASLVVENLDGYSNLSRSGRRLRTVLALPLLAKGEIFGAVILAASSRRFDSQQECLLSFLSSYLGDMIEKAKLFQLLEHAKGEWEHTFDSLSDLVSIISPDFRILRTNMALAHKLKKSPRQIVGKKCFEVLGCPGYPAANCPHFKAIKNRISSSEEIEYFSGEYIYQVTASPVFDKKGKVVSTAHIAHDVSERKKMEQQLLQMQKMESVGALAGGIAHDFNNLLAGILGYASYVKEQIKVDNPIYEEIGFIETSAEKAANLSKQLLTFARGVKYEPKPVNLNMIVESVVKLLSCTVDKNISIRYSLAEGKAIVKGDAGQLEQALLNFCLNARDAMPNGGKLTIETREVYLGEDFVRNHLGAISGRYVLLSIADTGLGMDKATKEKIFEPFFTTKELGQGTGLGLAVVYGVVKNHKGYIDIYSEKGQGTVFKVYFPRYVQRPVAPIQKAAKAKPVQSKKSILVVDDEDGLRRLLGKILRQNGYKVFLAQDGHQAVSTFRKHSKQIDLVILDMTTPGMDGKEVYHLLREIRADIRILFSSGYSPDGKMQQLIKKANGFIQKPYRGEELLDKIKEVCK